MSEHAEMVTENARQQLDRIEGLLSPTSGTALDLGTLADWQDPAELYQRLARISQALRDRLKSVNAIISDDQGELVEAGDIEESPQFDAALAEAEAAEKPAAALADQLRTAATAFKQDQADEHERCLGAHPGPVGPVDCDGRPF